MDQQAGQLNRKRIFELRLANFLHGAAGATIGFNVLFLKTQGMDPGMVGIVMGLNSLLGAVSPPLWGIFADRIHSKYRIFVYTILGAAAVSMVVPVSAMVSIGGVLLTTAIIPLMNFFRMPSQSMIDAATVTASTMVEGMEYSNVRYWMSIGFTVMSFAYSPLVSLFGVAFPFYAFVFFTALLFLSRKTIRQYDVQQGHKDGPKPKMELSRLFKNYYLIVFLTINILMMVPLNCMSMLPYLLTDIGADASLIGTVTGVRVCGEILVLIFAQRIRRLLSQPVMMSMAVLCVLAEQTLYQLAHSVPAISAAAVFGGASFGFILSTGFNYVNNLAPDGLKATSISLYSIGGPVAGMLVSFIGGQIIMYQGIRTLFLYTESCMILWFLLFIGSFAFGEKVLKKKPPMPFFKRV